MDTMIRDAYAAFARQAAELVRMPGRVFDRIVDEHLGAMPSGAVDAAIALVSAGADGVWASRLVVAVYLVERLRRLDLGIRLATPEDLPTAWIDVANVSY